jgi:ABC-type multidrug transport system fused ATPase/permease subunit
MMPTGGLRFGSKSVVFASIHAIRATLRHLGPSATRLFQGLVVVAFLERLAVGAAAVATILVGMRGLAIAAGALLLVRLGRGAWAARLRRDTYALLLERGARSFAEAGVPSATADEDPQETLMEGSARAQSVIADVVPDAVSGLPAAVLTGCVIAANTTLPSIPWVVVVLALVGLGACALALAMGRLVARAESRARFALGVLLGRVTTVARARLEIAATGRAPEVAREIAARTTLWRTAARRSEWLSGAATRGPALLGILALVLLLNQELRPDGTPWALALALAGVHSAIVGLVAAITVVRAVPSFDRLLAVLQAPALPNGGSAPTPQSPAEIKVIELAVRPGPTSELSRELVYPSFVLRRGELLAVRGPSGSGKSTLLRTLAAVHMPTRGRIDVEGCSLGKLDLHAWRRSISFVPQAPYLPDRVNIRAAARCTGSEIDDESLLFWLAKLGVSAELEQLCPQDPLDARTGTLSMGQRQRVVLARAFAEQRPLILLDEPDAALDRRAIEVLSHVLLEERSGRMIAISAHDAALCGIADRVIDLTPSLAAEPEHLAEAAPNSRRVDASPRKRAVNTGRDE